MLETKGRVGSVEVWFKSSPAQDVDMEMLAGMGSMWHVWSFPAPSASTDPTIWQGIHWITK